MTATTYILTEVKLKRILGKRRAALNEHNDVRVMYGNLVGVAKFDTEAIYCSHQNCKQQLNVGETIVSKTTSHHLAKFYHESCAISLNVI